MRSRGFACCRYADSLALAMRPFLAGTIHAKNMVDHAVELQDQAPKK
jgi:hypothetical protein